MGASQSQSVTIGRKRVKNKNNKSANKKQINSFFKKDASSGNNPKSRITSKRNTNRSKKNKKQTKPKQKSEDDDFMNDIMANLDSDNENEKQQDIPMATTVSEPIEDKQTQPIAKQSVGPPKKRFKSAPIVASKEEADEPVSTPNDDEMMTMMA